MLYISDESNGHTVYFSTNRDDRKFYITVFGDYVDIDTLTVTDAFRLASSDNSDEISEADKFVVKHTLQDIILPSIYRSEYGKSYEEEMVDFAATMYFVTDCVDSLVKYFITSYGYSADKYPELQELYNNQKYLTCLMLLAEDEYIDTYVGNRLLNLISDAIGYGYDIILHYITEDVICMQLPKTRT